MGNFLCGRFRSPGKSGHSPTNPKCGRHIGRVDAGLLLALGYNSTEISKKIREANYARFLDHGNVNQIVKQYGYYNGDYATEEFHHWVQEKLGSPEATFGDLCEANGLDLRVYATNLNTRQVFEFSYNKSRQVCLADAVRASMSVPLFFAATEIDGQIFVDGGQSLTSAGGVRQERDRLHAWPGVCPIFRGGNGRPGRPGIRL